MTKKHMINPKSFVEEARKVGVTYDILQECILCKGQQAAARMFEGKSKRGGGDSLSAAAMVNWILTFEYVRDHPEEEDKDPYQARRIQPTEEWFEFVKLINRPISESEIESWRTYSTKGLGDMAIKHGITVGVRNANAVKNLLERMLNMAERRKRLFWSIEDDEDEDNTPIQVNYRLMNVKKLHHLCKQRGITSLHMKKDEMIEKLKAYSAKKTDEVITENYDALSLASLKQKAKEKGLTEYNNLLKPQIINSLLEVDREEQNIREDDAKLMIHGITLVARKSDKYVNVTRFLQANNKLFANWNKAQHSHLFLQELSESIKIPEDKLIEVSRVTDTWVHPRVAINIAQWVSPKFDVAVSGWVFQLLSEGEVKIRRPVHCLTDLTEIDIEAEVLEETVEWYNHTNHCTLYVAYIGKGMVKVGYSDGRFLARDLKHQSSESEYPQWRVIGLFRISGRPVETIMHDMLYKYKASFNKQKEIYRPVNKLGEFLSVIKQLLFDNDLKLRVEDLEKENMSLKLIIKDLKSNHKC